MFDDHSHKAPELRDERDRMEERWRSSQKSNRRLGAGLLLLAACLAALVWIGYPAYRAHTTATTDLPEVRQTVDTLDERIAATEAGAAAHQEQMRTEIGQGLEAMRARLAAAAKQAGNATASLVGQAKSEIQEQLGGLRTRLADVETSVKASQESDQQQIGALRQELNEARSQIANQSSQLSALRADMGRRVEQNAKSVANTEQQVAALRERQTRDRGDFDALATNVARRRVDFEVSKGQPRVIVPGVSLGVNGTNVDYQRTNGWVLAPDRRTIWLRELRTQEPVVLFSTADGRNHELVITRVSKDSVIGYVVVPVESVPSRAAASSAGDGE